MLKAPDGLYGVIVEDVKCQLNSFELNSLESVGGKKDDAIFRSIRIEYLQSIADYRWWRSYRRRLKESSEWIARTNWGTTATRGEVTGG